MQPLSEEELQIRQRLKDDFQHYAAKCLKIRTKTGSIEPLIFNTAQLYLHQQAEKQLKETGKVRIIGLKGRQQGFSTYVEARAYWRTTHRRGYRAFILTHEAEATANLFKMASRFHEHCPDLVKPKTGANSANELVFSDLDSDYKVGTAGNKGAGRSQTIQFLHGSEVGLWPNAEEHAAGVMQAIPGAADTEVFLESTAKGLGNYFHKKWQEAQAGEGEYRAVFVPWYWQAEYSVAPQTPLRLSVDERTYKEFYGLTDAQMYWRRLKIAELKDEMLFKQEYPATASEAFQVTGVDSYISPALVLAARKNTEAQESGPLVVGVDPARFGDDRTGIIYRRGRVAKDMKWYAKKDTMEVAGICSRILKDDKPAAMFIDVGGLGAGVVDRLRELGWSDKVIPVNSAEKANNSDINHNKRAEMWRNLKEWLEEKPVKIPDEDLLQSDICAPSYKYDSNNCLLIEKKEDIKKRGLRSPDLADALCLTFANPVGESNNTQPLAIHEPDADGFYF